MRFVIVGGRKLHRVRRHERQLQARGELGHRQHMPFVVGAARTLHLQIKPVRKDARQAQRRVAGCSIVAAQKRLPHRARLCAGQGNQAVSQLLQPLPACHGLRF